MKPKLIEQTIATNIHVGSLIVDVRGDLWFGTPEESTHMYGPFSGSTKILKMLEEREIIPLRR